MIEKTLNLKLRPLNLNRRFCLPWACAFKVLEVQVGTRPASMFAIMLQNLHVPFTMIFFRTWCDMDTGTDLQSRVRHP